MAMAIQRDGSSWFEPGGGGEGVREGGRQEERAGGRK